MPAPPLLRFSVPPGGLRGADPGAASGSAALLVTGMAAEGAAGPRRTAADCAGKLLFQVRRPRLSPLSPLSHTLLCAC